MLSSFQSGFIPGDSTVNQLTYLYHTFCEALDSGKEVRAVFCDISKAFDRVWHAGLLYKLEAAGVTGEVLNWFKSYLSDRRQRVVLPGVSSNWNYIRAGVPQGSILGPLLFLLFINDIVNDIGSNIRLFADDTSSIENAQHYFFHCRFYHQQRAILLNEIRFYRVPTLDLLLYGDLSLSYEINVNIFHHVHKYIIATQRF